MRTFLSATALLPSLAAAAPLPDGINELFAGTSMKHFYSQENLRDAMRDIGAPEVPAGNAEFFLGNSPGKAWFVTIVHGVCGGAARRHGLRRVRATRRPRPSACGLLGIGGHRP